MTRTYDIAPVPSASSVRQLRTMRRLLIEQLNAARISLAALEAALTTVEAELKDTLADVRGDD